MGAAITSHFLMGGLLSKTTVAPLYLPFTASMINLSLGRVSG